MKLSKIASALAASLCLAVASVPARAQTYPDRPIRIVVPFAPGGGADMVARRIAEPLGKRLGQPVIVENRPGAGGTTGAAHVAQSQPDGHTLLYATPGQQMTNPHLMKVPYDPVKDLAAVGQIVDGGTILVVHKDVPARSVADLVALAKAKPGLTFASAGVGASSHLAGELFKRATGIEIVHVAYRGTGPALLDLVAGRVSMAFDSVNVLQPHIASGAVRAIAVSSLGRNLNLPDLPAISETLPGFEASPINYLSAPAKTPKPIIARLNRELNAVLAMPEIQEFFRSTGTTAKGGTPEEMEALIRRESAKWKTVIEQSAVRID